ncbi:MULTISPECIES: oligoribonuclease [Candidatus Ichthyocystis]|uniref:Oligoribonuclease n=1 Tax=Candidatus Ichthyocystis hellenicum TaxID=1561003 RepID=A0A0S4M441_9BURK|nr:MULTISPECIES: oligoribonuclease [Ichthyocystis]CUT17775.1 Oligoribonuclease [Candidatus Ichthyocystis hellenicum]
MQNEFNLIWVDLEMTGLSPDNDRILEIAMIVTDMHLNTLAEGPVLAVHQSDDILDKMDAWNQGTHRRSGLIERVKLSTFDEEKVKDQYLEFLHKHALPNKSPMCGNSICQDRRFLARYMPELESFFHYRNLDVSSIKELVRRWKPELLKLRKRNLAHQALLDVRQSIAELQFYRAMFISS